MTRLAMPAAGSPVPAGQGWSRLDHRQPRIDTAPLRSPAPAGPGRTGRRDGWHRAGIAICMLLLGSAGPVAARRLPSDAAGTAIQTPTRPRPPDPDPPGWLPPDHWTRHAIDRLAATGRLPAAATALAWPARRAAVRRLLAAMAGDSGRANASGWLGRFDAEFHQLNVGPIGFVGSAGAGARSADGRLLAGRTITTPARLEYTGPSRGIERTGVFYESEAAVRIGAHLGGAVELNAWQSERPEWRRITAEAGFGVISAWIGRREAGFGPFRDGGFVLSGGVPFDGGGIDTDAFRLPGFLAGLGRVRTDLVVARLERSGDIAHPWFVATHVSFAPSARVSFGMNRAALFGGSGNEPVTLGRLLLVTFGITDSHAKDSDFENQVASLDVAWNPAPKWLVRAEYGFDDSGLAFIRVPGLTVGALLAGPAWAPALSLGASVTGIASSCCSYPAWYVHGALADGWTDRGVLLGHPLGGNGLEVSFDWAVDPVSAPIAARGRLFARDRGRENLFSPDRLGRTAGAEARLETFTGRWRIEADLRTENGAGPDRWSAILRAVLAL